MKGIHKEEIQFLMILLTVASLCVSSSGSMATTCHPGWKENVLNYEPGF